MTNNMIKTQVPWRINTANPGKRAEYERLFRKNADMLDRDKPLIFTSLEIDEIDADPISVVVHKASMVGSGVLVDDTSLDVEGAKVGIHVKWLKDTLVDYLGKKATMRVLLAYREGDQVYVYAGETLGHIATPVAKSNKAFGFDPVFMPDGANKTFAEDKPDTLHPRAKASLS
jgi:XTP/dITP diphosphohydrolase